VRAVGRSGHDDCEFTIVVAMCPAKPSYPAMSDDGIGYVISEVTQRNPICAVDVSID
jgi:hypothetical protein